MGNIFTLVLTQPLINGLIVLYEYVTFADLGLAIIALTILIRLLLYPVFYKGLQNQALMQKMQPEIKAAQKKHKGDREVQATAIMEVYKKYKVNPFSPFLYLLIQLPILLAVYRVFLKGFTSETLALAYPFVHQPEALNTMFLGLIDVTQTSMIIVIAAVIAQYIQTKLSLQPKLDAQKGKPKDATSKMSQYMIYIVPLITLVFLLNLPSAIGLYWLTTAIFSIFQQRIINRRMEAEKQVKEKTA